MLAKCSGLNLKGLYLSLEKEKENFCVEFTYSIKRASEIRKFHVVVVQRRQRNVQNTGFVPVFKQNFQGLSRTHFPYFKDSIQFKEPYVFY